MSEIALALKPDFDRLSEALGRTPSFWWRDDDLVAVTPQLQRLSEFAERHQAPCLLSAISGRVSSELSDWNVSDPRLHYACHGLHHKNHQWLSLFPREFSRSRSSSDVKSDLSQALNSVSAVFGQRALPILVPPWNRFNRKHYEVLAQSGFRGFSGFAPSYSGNWPSSVRRVDVNLDILDWRKSPVVLDRDVIVSRLRRLMRRLARSSEKHSQSEIIGILTHHRVMDESAWSVLEEIFNSFLGWDMRPANPKQLFRLDGFAC